MVVIMTQLLRTEMKFRSFLLILGTPIKGWSVFAFGEKKETSI